MKRNPKILILSACALLFLLVGALLLPVMAATTITTYASHDFNSWTLNTKGSALKNNGYTSNDWTPPSTATVVKDPTDSGNRVIKIENKVASTATLSYYFVAYSNSACQVTWNDSTKTTGTFTYKSTTYTVTNNGDGTAKVNGTGSYILSNSAEIKEALQGGDNVDKNLVMKHEVMTSKKIVMQVDYYIPTGATGSFQSQQTKYSYNGGTGQTWLDLYDINCATGVIRFSGFGNTNNSAELEKDVWNTITMVIDLANGDLEYYINHVFVISGKLAKGSTKLTNVSFTADSWNVAKILKAGAVKGAYSGCFYVDNAICHSYADDLKTTYSSQEDANGVPMYVSVTTNHNRTVKVDINATILQNTNASAQVAYLAPSQTEGLIAPVPGASVRISNSSGIRFGTQLNTAKLDELIALKNAGDIKNVSIGTIITPASYVKEAGAFTVEALKSLSYSSTILDVPATIGKYFYIENFTLDSGYNKTFVGSIIDIRVANLKRDFAAIGYVKVTMIDGRETYIYSYEYNAAYEAAFDADHSRNISYIASQLLGNDKYDQSVIEYLSQGANYPFTGIGTSIVKNTEYSNSAFFFQNAQGISNRLTYDGNNGWRLQSIKPASDTATYRYNGFENVGAAQSLAIYMGEEYRTPDASIKATLVGNQIKITAAGTDSYVLINTTGSFNVQFMTASGAVANNITSITSNGTEIVLKGGLLSNEAIYGGGERFDAANKRGKSLNLYTYDAYNGGKDYSGTYTVIPLFTSSRGSGMFINRYEPMVVDFGKTSSNVWSVTLDNDLADVYFYSTGKITDAIKGYTDLSGHAALPEEWAQGVLICRYSPDYSTVDGVQIEYSTLESIPGYENLTYSSGGTDYVKDNKSKLTSASSYVILYSGKSAKYTYYQGTFYNRGPKGSPGGWGVRDIVENLIAAGMHPDAVIMEAPTSTWMNSTNGSNGAENNLKTLKDIIAYLDSKNVKTMLYMGIAGLSNNMKGIKPEYYVRAYVDGVLTNAIPKSTSDNPDAIGSTSQSYLDITNPEAVEWHINYIWGTLLDLGVDGVKIDFCETMPNEGSFNGKTIDYQWYDDSIFEGDDIHHAYASYYISMFYEKMVELKQEKKLDDGFSVLSRGGGIGSQRNPYMWAGDQVRNETNLAVQLLSVINSGISGIPFMTYDMAGYAYDGTNNYFGGGVLGTTAAATKANEEKIFIRAIQYTAFGTAIQTHGDVRQVFEMSKETQETVALYTQLHRDLMPYLRELSEIACNTGMPIVRHMVLEYQNDSNVWDIDDQFMMGDALLVAPILSITGNTRTVYLPEGEWIDLLTGEEISVGAGGKEITVTVGMEQVPVYLNTESAYATQVGMVFNMNAWQTINGGKIIQLAENPGDPYQDDIFPIK